jgi:hypothetical protein
MASLTSLGSCRLPRLRAPELVKRSDARSVLAQAVFCKVEGGALGAQKLKRTSRAPIPRQ